MISDFDVPPPLATTVNPTLDHFAWHKQNPETQILQTPLLETMWHMPNSHAANQTTLKFDERAFNDRLVIKMTYLLRFIFSHDVK